MAKIKEVWDYLKVRKRYWLGPIVVLILVLVFKMLYKMMFSVQDEYPMF